MTLDRRRARPATPATSCCTRSAAPASSASSAARVLVVGAGGLGSPALLYLAAAGVGTLAIVDDDAVSLSNLQRQVLHATAEIGAPKAESAARALAPPQPARRRRDRTPLRLDAAARRRARPGLRPGPRRQRQLRHPLPRQRRLRRRRPAAGLRGDEPVGGPDRPLRPGPRRPLLPCVFPEPPAPELTPACAQAGIVGALPGVMGAMMALEAIKLDRRRRHAAPRRAADLRRAPRRDPPHPHRAAPGLPGLPRRRRLSALTPSPPRRSRARR